MLVVLPFLLAAFVLPATQCIGTAQAGTVKPAGWSASSAATPNEERNFEVTNVGDLKQSSAWVEGDQGGGLGAWISADLGGEKALTGMQIWTGNWYNAEFWGHYNRPKTVVVEFSDGATEEVSLTDVYKPQDVSFKTPHTTSSVKLKVKAIYPGKGVDTAISEVVFKDGTRAASHPVVKFTASTTFPPDPDGDYEADNAADGIVDSMWCEGNKISDGTGEWLEFGFAGKVSVSSIKLRNGSAYSPALFMKGNRASSATLTFSDASTESVMLKDIFFEQTVSFPSRTTDKLRVTFTGVKKGTEYNDLCLSEATFLP